MLEPVFLKFEECFMERIWGGSQLRRVLHKGVPAGRTIGESWMISDHPACESVVAEGPYAGRSLRRLMEMDAAGILGAKVALTREGRFPLLLKLIDAAENLSVQVHPDDEQARILGEPDSGKTEMWYVLNADGECEVALGLCAGVTRDTLEACLRDGGDAAGLLSRFSVRGGESIVVNAGTAHAIGAGVLLAEIQQNSNITYRLFDYGRIDADGRPRELHLEKGLAVTRFDEAPGNCVPPVRFTRAGVTREFLSACRYFAVEKVFLTGGCEYEGPARSFRIVLSLEHPVVLEGDSGACVLNRGEAALIPASMPAWRISGQGSFLEYYVPDLYADVIAPLRWQGHADSEILPLGGTGGGNDLQPLLERA